MFLTRWQTSLIVNLEAALVVEAEGKARSPGGVPKPSGPLVFTSRTCGVTSSSDRKLRTGSSGTRCLEPGVLGGEGANRSNLYTSQLVSPVVTFCRRRSVGDVPRDALRLLSLDG